MQSTFILFSILSFSGIFCEELRLTGLFFGCSRDLTGEYHRALQEFSTRLYKEVAKENQDHFVLSQYSIWLALSSIAEGSKEDVQKNLFKALNLPNDSCVREKYYEIATSLETSADDIILSRKRLLIIDDEAKLNTSWVSAVRASGLIDTRKANLRNNSEVTDLKNLINATLKDLEVSGNAIMLDALDYEGLWTTAFENASTVPSDFYNDKGEVVGKVDLMKVKRRVKLAHIPLLNAKLMELPVGNNGRYRMLFILNHGKTRIRQTIERFPSSFIVDMMPLLIESVIPLELAIPRFTMTSELDLKNALDKIGFESLWKDGNVGQYISAEPFKPATLYQRATITFDQPGLTPPSPPPMPALTNIATYLAAVVGRGFLANRPFIYGLVDADTRTWLFSGAFSKPGDL